MLTTPTYPRINPALIGPATEVFFHNGELHYQHDGRRGTWNDMPVHLMDKFRERLAEDTAALQHLLDWSREQPMDILKQYVQCNYGGYDNVPDIDEQGNLQACEYNNCGNRGNCKYEGKVCQALSVANGTLTKMELQVLRLAHEPSKHIAGRLYISIDTVHSHLKSLGKKTGYTRAGLVQFALIKGINH